MPIASGVAKQVRYKTEATFGSAPGASGAQLLRRTESSLALSKDTYESQEINTTYQTNDMRHGVRRVAGNINGELSPGTYKDFIAAALRRDFAAVTAISALSLTLAGSGPYTLTRGSGSWLTDGLKIGDVIRITAGAVNASNSNKNLLITALTATVATVIVLNATALVAEGPIVSCTVSVPGKKSFVPASGHTDKSFYIEHWFSDIAQSHQFSGCKVGSVGIKLPPTGLAGIDIAFQGKDMATATSAYYTSPAAATATGTVAAVNGVLLVNGAAIAICTGLDINLEGGLSGDPVIGSNTVPAIFQGLVKVSGQFTAYFETGTLRDAFLNETEISLVVALTTGNAAAADFIAFSLPRIKVGGASENDSQSGIIQTFPFTALYNGAGGAGISSEATTLLVQDSQA